jgi:hypothetical protein
MTRQVRDRLAKVAIVVNDLVHSKPQLQELLSVGSGGDTDLRQYQAVHDDVKARLRNKFEAAANKESET